MSSKVSRIARQMHSVAMLNHYAQMENANAIKHIQNLYKDNSDHLIIAESAFKIYNTISELKSADIIAAILKVCLTCHQIDKSLSLWSDIKLLSHQPQQSDNITVYLLFLKCCTKSTNNIDIDQCIQVLKLIRNCPYRICQEYDFKDYSISMNKLISKCSKYDIDKINTIKALSEEIQIDDVFIKTALINAYAKCNDIDGALNIFNSLKNEKKDCAIMNAIIKWLVKFNQFESALKVYDQHRWLHDDVSHILILRVFQHFNCLDRAQFIHQTVGKNTDISLKNALIDFYGHFGDVDNAMDIFNGIQHDQMDKISLGSIIKCLVNNERYQMALKIYDDFESYHDDKTHAFAIKACSYSDDFEKGKQIRSKIESNGDPFISSVLIDFYGNFGSIWTAQRIFRSVPFQKRDITLIASMMDAYCKSNMNFEALKLFKYYLNKQKPDLICYVIALKACTQGTAYHIGLELHHKLKTDASFIDILHKCEIETSLINFYGKCGKLDIACDIFKESKNKKDISLWNAMINAFGRNGNVVKAKELLFNCFRSGMIADVHTFVFLINACAHSGDTEDAKAIWNIISDENIKYNQYVVTSLVDCLSRNGRFEEGKQLIFEYERINEIKHYPMWLALLSALCRNRKQCNMTMAEEIHNEMKDRFNEMQMRAASIMLSNVYQREIELDI